MRHAGLIAGMGIVASLFVLGIGVGYELNEGVSPLSDWMPFAGLVLLVSVGMLIWVIRKHAGDPPPPFPARHRKTKPVTEYHSKEQLVYLSDKMMLATCEHLQPVERAMREAGIRTALRGNLFIEAECRVDPEKLSLELPARYIGNEPGDRPRDPDGALFACMEHASVIRVIHPDYARPETPIFPA